MTEEVIKCTCGCSILERIEANRYGKQSGLSRYVVPWYLFRCIKCGNLILGHGHTDEELKNYLLSEENI